MKIIYLIALLICANTFSQDFLSIEEAMKNASKKNETFKEYSVFEHSTQKINSSLREIAPGIQSISVSKSALSTIQKETPEFIHFYVYHEDDTLSVKMQRHQVLTDDFKVRNQDDKVLKYKPGLYYRGIVNNDFKSLAVFSFFDETLNGIISSPSNGNRIVAQLRNKNQYVIYDDAKMTVSQDFTCQVDEIEQFGDLVPQTDFSNSTSASANCVRVFYELTNDIYVNNSSSTSSTLNWLTSVHNIVATLYSDSNIPTALSEALIWQVEDPYTGDNLDKLTYFRQNRIAFNGDLAHLLDLPVTGGVAYINSLCQNFNYAFSGLSLNYQELPTYSWTVNVVSHEMGHSLGSPHTHACFWNGDNTAIDSCGPNNGYSEGCDDADIPSEGGTIMSYCHLDATGMNLALGFHPQVEAYMNNNIDTKSCLGTDCIDSCTRTIAGVTVNQSNENSFIVNIDDVISNSWIYRIYEQNTTPGSFNTINSNSILFDDDVKPNTYYVIQVGNNCSNGNVGGSFQSNYLTDDDWCSGRIFTDTGGLNGNYPSNQNFLKTFYPEDSANKISFTINDFDLEDGADFMTIYDGESINSPIFLDGENLTGNNLTTTYFEASNNTGAITVSFTSNFANANNSGWEILVSCETLSTLEFSEDDISIYPNPFNDKLFITSKVDFDKVLIYDINGKQVYKKNLKSQTENDLNLNQLNTGLYFLKLINKDASYIKRILKR